MNYSVQEEAKAFENKLRKKIYDISARDMRGDYVNAAVMWLEIWPEMKDYVIKFYYKQTDKGVIKPDLEEILESTDYEMNLYNLIPEMAMLLYNAGKYAETIAYCREALELFRWERSNPAELKDFIGMAFRETEGAEAAIQWYEEWLAEEPDSGDCINCYASLLQEEGRLEEAVRLVEAHLPEKEEQDSKYFNLYLRASEVYEEMGDHKKAEYYRKLQNIAGYGEHNPDSDVNMYYDKYGIPVMSTMGDMSLFGMPGLSEKEKKQEPIKKDKKIYPNDPCPCGSGKKYKKCCGRGK